jgi:oligoribonuclease
MPRHPDNLAWIDLEMTGLRPEFDRIIEVATIVTDRDLVVLAEGPVLAVHPDDDTLALMDEWNQRTHAASGLLPRVRASRVDEVEAERRTLDFLGEWLAPGVSPMCGNSICQDRRFLAHYMPALEQFFHYRNLDVSTLKELARRWAPPVLAGVGKSNSHQALDDVRDSIAELRHYRRELFAAPYTGAPG